MGLDQYVGVKKSINSWRKKYNESIMTEAIQKVLDVDLQVDAVEFELQYFRKANHIHGWFEKLAPEDWQGEQFSVDRDKILELRKLCAEILEKKDDELSAEILPPTQGAFFGGNDIDAYYYRSVKEMYDAINKIESLKDSEEWYYTYSASW